MKHLNEFSKFVLIGLFGILLANCQKEDSQSESLLKSASIAKTEIKSIPEIASTSSDLQNLVAEINSMVNDGTLTKGEGQSLIAKINNAQKSIDKGNTNAVDGQLGALITEIESFVADGTISLEQGQSITNVAEYVVNVTIGKPLITDGLIAYYPFNGNTYDESGNNKNGVSDNIAYTVGKDGNPNTAVNFSGNGYVKVPPIGQTNSSFSIALWYKTDLGGTILSTDNIYFGADPLYHQFLASWNIIMNGGPATYAAAGNPVYLDGTWHHVVITHDSNDSRIITYFDGEVRHDRPESGYFVGNNIDILIGLVDKDAVVQFPYVTDYFTGSLDDIYFFNRAISSLEVEKLYYRPN